MGANTRYLYLDIAKGLGMLFVVWGHINSSGPICTFFYFFHMPLFFFISGMLFSSQRYKNIGQFVLHKSQTLLLPYLIYSILTWLIWVFYNYISHSNDCEIWHPLLQTIIAQGSQDYLVHNTALWFVPCLVAVECIYYLLSKLNRIWSVVLCALFPLINIIAISFIGGTWEALPWNIDAGLMAIPFFCGGNLLKDYFGHSRIEKIIMHSKIVSIICISALYAILLFEAKTCPKISMGHSYYGISIVGFYFRAFIGIIATISLSVLLESIIVNDRKYIKKLALFCNWFGRNSFDAMSLNVPIKGVVIVLYANICKISLMDVWTEATTSIIPFIITMLILSTTMLIIVKYIRPTIHNAIFHR